MSFRAYIGCCRDCDNAGAITGFHIYEPRFCSRKGATRVAYRVRKEVKTGKGEESSVPEGMQLCNTAYSTYCIWWWGRKSSRSIWCTKGLAFTRVVNKVELFKENVESKFQRVVALVIDCGWFMGNRNQQLIRYSPLCGRADLFSSVWPGCVSSSSTTPIKGIALY